MTKEKYMLEDFLEQTEFKDYNDFFANYKIKVPANFNFGYDVVDVLAQRTPDATAFIWCNDNDEELRMTFGELKEAIAKRTEEFAGLPVNKDVFGMVHFDYCDGNYHVDMSTGEITVFDFDNCIYCWYMFDLAHTWTHGIGWCQFEPDPKKRLAFMEYFFDTVIEGYRSETDVSDDMLDKLQLFIDMTLIENIVDEFECAARKGEEVDEEDIRQAAFCLINDISLLGIG